MWQPTQLAKQPTNQPDQLTSLGKSALFSASGTIPWGSPQRTPRVDTPRGYPTSTQIYYYNSVEGGTNVVAMEIV